MTSLTNVSGISNANQYFLFNELFQERECVLIMQVNIKSTNYVALKAYVNIEHFAMIGRHFPPGDKSEFLVY